MITHGEQEMTKVVALLPDGSSGAPCGACRELLMQVSLKNADMEILEDFDTRKTVQLKELLPKWWGDRRYQES